MSTILAVKVNAYSLKLAQVKRDWNQVRVEKWATKMLPNQADWDSIAQIAKRAIEEQALERDRIVLGLPAGLIFLRQLWFPFTKREKVNQVIRFELEQGFPKDFDDKVVDFYKTEPELSKLYPYLACIACKKSVGDALEAFKQEGLDLKSIDLGSSGLEPLVRHSQAQKEDPGLFVHLDWSETVILFRSKGSVNRLRPLNMGLMQLFKSLGWQDDGLDDEQNLIRLQRMLDKAGQSSEEQESVLQKAEKKVSEFLFRLVREIELTVTEAGHYSDNLELKTVHLSGPALNLPMIQKELGRLLETPVQSLAQEMEEGLFAEADHFANYGLAAGLALARTRKMPCFNLRKDEFAKTRTYSKWKKQIIYLTAACALIFFSWLGASLVQVQALKSESKDLRQKMEEVFHRAVPEARGDFKAVQYASIIKSRIERYQSGGQVSSEVSSYKPCLLQLKKISKIIPREFEVKIDLYSFDSGRIRISGKAMDFNTVEKVKNMLLEKADFSSVSIKGAKAARSGQGINFSLEILV